jgi:hypothetical protein
MNRRTLTIALSIFFTTLFLIGGILNLVEADYIQAAGFFLLSASNVPPLLGVFRGRAVTARETMITNVLAIVGLALVVVSWFGTF